MHIFERSEDLVHYVLLMNFFKDVCSDHCMQVCFHIFEHKIDISVIFGLQHIQESEHNNKKWLLNSLEQGFYWAFKRRNTRGQLKGRVASVTHLMIFSWLLSSWRNIISLNVLCNNGEMEMEIHLARLPSQESEISHIDRSSRRGSIRT